MANTPPAERPDALVNNADAKQYWEDVSADSNGMLGGFPHVSRSDLRVSRNFLAKLGIGTKPNLRRLSCVLEGGAGIGRVTEGLLLDVAEKVDVIEPVVKFTEKLKCKPGVRQVFNVGLEGWDPAGVSRVNTEESGLFYNLIWLQWCVGYLNDEQLVDFLHRCQTVLEPVTGIIVLKENITSTKEDDFDTVDSGVTRADKSFLAIFTKAGFQVVRSEVQRFPEEPDLLSVKIYALKPRGL